MNILKDDKQVVVIFTRSEATCLGAVLDACLDTVGNIEGRDIGITNRQLSKAEDNMTKLSMLANDHA